MDSSSSSSNKVEEEEEVWDAESPESESSRVTSTLHLFPVAWGAAVFLRILGVLWWLWIVLIKAELSRLNSSSGGGQNCQLAPLFNRPNWSLNQAASSKALISYSCLSSSGVVSVLVLSSHLHRGTAQTIDALQDFLISSRTMSLGKWEVQVHQHVKKGSG